MKKLSKVLVLVLSAIMVLAMSTSVFAAVGDFTGTAETTISATDVTEGDSVSYFQLVEWDSTNTDWKLTTLGESCGVTLQNLVDGITEAEATTIANNVSGTGTAMTPDSAGTTFTATVAPGLYYLKATPGTDNKDTVYNPAFVSADYYEGGNVISFSSKYDNSSVMKKSSVPFDKDVVGADKYIDTKPGDVIPYIIKATIPSYGTSFTNPKFEITDTLSAGLELQTPISVKYGNTTVQATNDDVTITPNGTSGFTVSFKKDYLTGLAGDTPDVEIKYSAKVTTAATDNVTYMDNKAKLTFSNSPTTTKDQEDITRHYTFSIDANLNGGNHGNERTRELIKVGVKNGETVTAFTSWVEGQSWTTYKPLAGAEFKLAGNGIEKTYTTLDNGYITFNGLEAGTYTLTETKAPDGYIKDNTSHTVVITPTYSASEPDVLVSYIVTIDGQDSKYTITNMNDTVATVETTVDNTSMTVPIANTEGAELPSTGGIGTTIFYILGSLLVIGCGIVLISRKRMENNK